MRQSDRNTYLGGYHAKNFPVPSLILGVLLLAPPAFVQAIPLDWMSTSVDQQTQNVLFSLQFSAVPNLFGVDAFNRQQDSFQIYILDRPHDDIFSQPQPDGGASLRSVVRGEEIHFGGGLPIRDALPVAFDPISGGWGSIVATVPFVQSGETVSFIASFSTLRLTGNLPFGLGFETFHFGSTENSGFRCASGTVCSPGPPVSVPEPHMLWLTLIGLVGVALIAQRMRPRERRS